MALIGRRGLLVVAGGFTVMLLAAACGAQAPTPIPTKVPTATPRPPTPTPTPAMASPTLTPAVATLTPALVEGDPARGKALYSSKACNGCHGLNGEGVPGVAPKLAGIYGGKMTLADGSQVAVDDAYLMESIRTPSAKVVKGFQPIMAPFTLTDAEIEDIIAYIASLK